jgi:acyl dehydratase
VVGYFVRFTKPVPVPDDDAGVEVQVSARVTAVEDGVATIGVEALLGEVRVLGSAQAQVCLD